MKTSLSVWLPIFLTLLVICLPSILMAVEGNESPLGFFATSLHHTGEGMRYWYEGDGGFYHITQIPYMSDQLDCKNCHVNSCDRCHAEAEGEIFHYSTEIANDQDVTCLPCHKREKATFSLGKVSHSLDVHVTAGMSCTDCHGVEEIHGDGTVYHSMRDQGAVTASCADCHQFGEDASRAHTVHNDKLDCAACHVSNSVVCLNCHLESVINDQSRAGNFLPAQMDWTLLINYSGKVTTGTVQSLVYQDQKFITYAPFFTHAIQPTGKECVDCHANNAVLLIKNGESVPMAEFQDGNMVPWRGVVPCVPEKLTWSFLKKNEDNWVLIDNDDEVHWQLVAYGTPLTEDQIKRMAMPLKK